MTEQNKIRAIVMSRVHTIHALQILLSTTAASIAVLLISLWGIGREVWVSRVFQNSPSFMNVTAVAHFYMAAFLDTRFIVQLLSVLTIGASVWFVWNAFSMLQQASRGSVSGFRLQ